jgi:hypothetical protein
MNKLEGVIPDALGALPLLRTLTLDKNSLRGTVPDWLATHPCLREVDLSANRMSGRLPESLWDATLDDGEGGYGGGMYNKLHAS